MKIIDITTLPDIIPSI